MKKIMFNDRFGLTEAVLSGRKTQTRRIIPKSVLDKADDYRVEYYNGTLSGISEKEAIEQLYFAEKRLKLPYKVGEVVAVAQAYRTITDEFRAHQCIILSYTAGWKNKLFTRPELMPHSIRIMGVRVERLQDISNEDCIREGIMEGEFMNTWDRYYFDIWGDCALHKTFKTPRKAYASLIDRISGKGTWDSNPLVFVYVFELVD